jgi:hypothetical protein
MGTIKKANRKSIKMAKKYVSMSTARQRKLYRSEKTNYALKELIEKISPHSKALYLLAEKARRRTSKIKVERPKNKPKK